METGKIQVDRGEVGIFISRKDVLKYAPALNSLLLAINLDDLVEIPSKDVVGLREALDTIYEESESDTRSVKSQYASDFN